MIIHAADVPTSQYDHVMKTDAIDSEKLARSLRGGFLRGIYIRDKEELDDRGLSGYARLCKSNLGDINHE